MLNHSNSTYQQCNRCIMDNSSDALISFDQHGNCNYCTESLARMPNVYFPNETGRKALDKLISRLKNENKYNKYDCVMGISGGLDSSYLAYLGAVQWGLRILAVHIDDGFDTEISQRNIERISNFPNLDLHIISPDPHQFHELTKAYIRAGVPNLAVPQDNVLFASIYQFMKDHNIRSFLSGGNFALECILQKGNTHDAFDLRNIKYIHKKFGTAPIDKLTLTSKFKIDFDTYIRKIESPRPLNFIEYNRDKAMKELHDYCGFEYYGSKHLENTLTNFIQQYWFYNKFGVDKRTSHLSSMIVSNQMIREEALEIYKKPLYDITEMQAVIDSTLSKINMSEDELNKIMSEPAKQHTDYPISLYLKIKPYLSKIIKKII